MNCAYWLNCGVKINSVCFFVDKKLMIIARHWYCIDLLVQVVR